MLTAAKAQAAIVTALIKGRKFSVAMILVLATLLKIKNKHITGQLTVKLNEVDVTLSPQIESINKDFNKFFKFRLRNPLLFFIEDRKTLDAIWGDKTERWLVAMFKNNSIYILHPDSYERESSHKKEDFWINLKHEYCHAYYLQITKTIYPVWLNEGLASYKSGKEIRITEEGQSKLLKVFDYFEKSDKDVYFVGQFWVEYLLKKYGNRKFLKLINSFSQGLSIGKFNKIFFRVYGFKFNKRSFSEFIK